MNESNVRMTFLCEEACVNTAAGESWRGSKEYNLTIQEVQHLKDIGHLKRFKPLSNSAIDFMNDLDKKKEPAAKDAPEDKPIYKMTLSELKDYAVERGIDLPEDVKRNEAIQLLKE